MPLVQFTRNRLSVARNNLTRQLLHRKPNYVPRQRQLACSPITDYLYSCQKISSGSGFNFNKDQCHYKALAWKRSFSSAALENCEDDSLQLFEKVLIANRGEIACRIIKTCKRLGIRTVAVYSTADSRALHVQMADEAICLGAAPSLESYLNIDKLCIAIEQSGAQGVAPGYGFLSENAEFSRRVNEMGVAFIGPPASAIEAMGDKITSKQIAKDAGVNVIPGFQGVVNDEEHALKLASEIGYPVILKAASGGGGKGIRVCYDEADTREGFVLSTAEAAQSFGDDRLLIERFVENPHHIEFQIVAATNKDLTEVLVFPERECSIQRRNQKVLEESPSLLLNSATRREMSRQSELLAKAVGYESAGTIEFLVEGKTPTSEDAVQPFFFLEMNTRLQVEHPVTEMVTSIDLVEQMLRVSSASYFGTHPTETTILSEPLLTAMRESVEGVVPFKGWALEARVYAEDPLHDFLPSTGPLLSYEEPTTAQVSRDMGGDSSVTVRLDSGVSLGTNITMFYDPMISKLVTYADALDSNKTARIKSIDAMVHALRRYVISGVQHNTSFLHHVLNKGDHSASKAFREGQTPTSFIETHYKDGFRESCLPIFNEIENNVPLLSKEVFALGIASTLYAYMDSATSISDILQGKPSKDFFLAIGGFFGTPIKLTLFANGSAAIVDGTTSLSIDRFDVQIDTTGNTAIMEIFVEDTLFVTQLFERTHDGSVKMHVNCGAIFEVFVRSPDEHDRALLMKIPPTVDTSLLILSPMPGKVMDIAVEVGDLVERGQDVCTIEAMKMQNIIKSPKRGVIERIDVEVGAPVKVDEVLLCFEED